LSTCQLKSRSTVSPVRMFLQRSNVKDSLVTLSLTWL